MSSNAAAANALMAGMQTLPQEGSILPKMNFPSQARMRNRRG